ncbi:MAG: signal peptide peptidase SppA, partial [Nitrospinaceae bacterium]|nr:signal peptide peptidase SppA [Nitrospinaceae bacterium]NIR56043.1 signal peptide peptidase SppA [Nitrospinaceae bacterium]NIS86487.1 signal peptide peptidase SppA [Nitrospinaceae bacterium]NIT83322.1 signal peptide peptidase SppA [Nitrospinaceae bacterium]NIU45532.1 signal peptide peptidase SppA [Nitrospinaceae bacterium]
MEPVNVGRKKRSFGRTLLIFLLGVLVLILLSVGLPSLLPDRMVTANNQIALVEVSGMILDSRDIVRQLTQYSRDASIQGIILRVDSPGGSVGPSQEIYDAVRKIQESDKKIYASLGSVAASGGYYIACAADRIFANPGTLTGSIGVIMAFSNIQKLIDKLGIRPEVIKSGEFKDAGSPVRPMTPEERNLLQTVVDDVHAQFIEAVARGRELPAEEVEK